ncbi:BTAD domain-containing putative transcriptional regulator [Amycolatopsis sp. cg5]|uniref:BTAD domain-containing putative transcriptional regulator n=1 Tax=Amycolatopsis sp. cg5 TaxID=3238802 RepID=UPI00352640F7
MTMRILGRAIRCCVSVSVVLALVAIPPVLLWVTRTAFIPDHVPSPNELLSWFTDRDTGQVFVAVLALAGLIAWLQLLVALALEVGGRLRGTQVPRLPGFGWAQKLAAAVLLALVTGTATAAASPSPPPAPPAASAPPTAGNVSAQFPQPEAPPVHVVQPGESLMQIAADRLGDENRYQEIFQLNKDRRQPDGRALRDVGLLRPGWTLNLPPDATEPCAEVTVKGGDTLSKVAREHLGDARRYPEIFTLNKDRPQPNGHPITDPNRIHPGTVLRLPSGLRPAGGAAAPSGQPQGGTAEAIAGGLPPAASGCGPTTPPSGRSVPEPQKSQPPEPSPAVPEKSPSPTTAASSTRPADTTTSKDASVPWGQIGIGGLLAAGILAALGTRRRLAQRKRRPGHRMQRPDTPGNVETALRATEQPGTVELLNRSLRTLADHIRQADESLPAISSVIIGSNGITVRPAQPGPPPAPLLGSQTEWVFDPDVPLLDHDQLEAVPAPYPALICLGHNADRELVLVNLEHIGAITLRGESDEVEAVLEAIAWNISAAAWADHLVTTLVGFGNITAAHNPDRLRYAETVDAALDVFERRAHEVADGLRAAGLASVDAARGNDLAEDTWTPEIILSARPFTASQQERLAALVESGGVATSLAAIITVDDTANPFPGAWELDLGATPTHIEALGADVELQRLGTADVHELIAMFAAADAAVQVPAEDFRNIPPEPTEIPETLDADQVLAPCPSTVDVPAEHEDPTVPEIRLLGPVRLCNLDIGKVESKKLNRLVELAAFLVLRSGATADEISRQLGTETQPWSAATRQAYISRLRTWLGRDHDGDLYLPNVATKPGGYRLSDTIGCDWHRFQRLANRGLNEDPARRLTYLQRALDLVEGMPFSNISQGRYAWSTWLQRDMIDAIVDVAHAVADAHQRAGNLTAARAALAKGLQAEPVSEILYRDLLRVEYRAGNLNAVKEAADKLAELAAALDVELDENTSELIRTLLEPRYRASTR